MGCKYCTEWEDLPEHIINGKPVGKVFDTDIDIDENGWHICLPSGADIGIKFCPYCGRELQTNEHNERTEVVKEFWDRLKVEVKKKIDYYTPEGCDIYFSNGTLCGYLAMKEVGENILAEMVGEDDGC